MRKLTRSLLAISFFIFTLCGCESVDKTTIEDTFHLNAYVQQNETSFNCDVNRQNSSDLCIKIKSDNNTNSLVYHYVNDTLYIEYEGMRCITNTDYLKSDSAVSLMYCVMSELENLSSYPSEIEDKVCVYTMKTEKVNALLSVDKNSGGILSVQFPDSACTVDFST